MTWEEKLRTGYVFKHRWCVQEGRLLSLASGNDRAEALRDANRCNAKMGLPTFTDAADVTIIQ